MVISKLDADVDVSQNLYATDQQKYDVQAEVNSIRKSIHQWGAVPNALVGLSFRY